MHRLRKGQPRPRHVTAVAMVGALLLLVVGACQPPVGETSPTTSSSTISSSTITGGGQIPSSRHADGLLTGATVGGGGPTDTGATTIVEIANLVVEDLEYFWSNNWSAAYPSVEFRYPNGYALYERGQIPNSACTSPTDDPALYVENAFYCPLDSSIVFESEWFAALWEEHGDFGPTAILAHEWGHHVQNLLRSVQDPLFSIQAELQADCFAGAWARKAGQSGAFPANDADIDEAAAAFYSVGGESQAGWFAPGVHGTPSERQNAFLLGFGSASLNACDSVVDYRMDQTFTLGSYVIGLLEGDTATAEAGGYTRVSGERYGNIAVEVTVVPVPPQTTAQQTLLSAMQTWAADQSAPHLSSLYPYHAIEDLTEYTRAARVNGSAVGFSYSQLLNGVSVHGYFFHHNLGAGSALVVDVYRPGEPPIDKSEWADLVAVVWRMLLSFQDS